MNELNDKWILVVALGLVFALTIGLSFKKSPASPDLYAQLSPISSVTVLVTPKRLVTKHNVTNVTKASPMSPIPINTFNADLTNKNSTPTSTVTLTRSSSPSPTLTMTPSHSPAPSPVMSLTPTPYISPSPQSPTLTPTPTAAVIQSTKININTANLAQLESLPGVGPVIAQRIIDYRTANRPFQTIEDIIKVKGIGTTTFQKMEGMITI